MQRGLSRGFVCSGASALLFAARAGHLDEGVAAGFYLVLCASSMFCALACRTGYIGLPRTMSGSLILLGLANVLGFLVSIPTYQGTIAAVEFLDALSHSVIVFVGVRCALGRRIW